MDDFAILPEADQLKPLVFGSDRNARRREDVANEVAKSDAVNHVEVCEHLGRVFSNDRIISMLPYFSRLADAGMAAMDLIAGSLLENSCVELTDVAALPAAKSISEELMLAAREWLNVANVQFRHVETAHRFASAFPNAQPIDCLRAMLHHHEVYGGGLRWFVLRNGWIEPRTPPGSGSSRYRFRLWSLCRLAAQCGVLSDMPRALLDESEEATDELAEVEGPAGATNG